MNKTLHVALGFEVVPAEQWRKIMPPPRKPANWKDETFQAKLPELMAAQETDAPYYPLTACVKSIWACPLGETKAAQIGGSPIALVTWLMKTGGHAEITVENTVLYGAGLRRQLRKLAMQSPGDFNAGRLLVDCPESPTKIDLISYCGVRDLFESAQALANAALGTVKYEERNARAEAEAGAAVALEYGLHEFAGKPGFSPLEW